MKFNADGTVDKQITISGGGGELNSNNSVDNSSNSHALIIPHTDADGTNSTGDTDLMEASKGLSDGFEVDFTQLGGTSRNSIGQPIIMFKAHG